MWNLPGPGIQPLSPALAGGFLTSGPTGKSLLCFQLFAKDFYCLWRAVAYNSLFCAANPRRDDISLKPFSFQRTGRLTKWLRKKRKVFGSCASKAHTVGMLIRGTDFHQNCFSQSTGSAFHTVWLHAQPVCGSGPCGSRFMAEESRPQQSMCLCEAHKFWTRLAWPGSQTHFWSQAWTRGLLKCLDIRRTLGTWFPKREIHFQEMVSAHCVTIIIPPLKKKKVKEETDAQRRQRAHLDATVT